MTIDQEDLLNKARETLQATKLLAANNLLDSAASRAYYTMFHLAGALLLGKGLTFSKHGSLLGACGLHLVKTGEVEAKFHRYLIDAQDNGIKGDYGVESNLTQAQVETMIAQAEEFLAMTEQMLGAAPPATPPST